MVLRLREAVTAQAPLHPDLGALARLAGDWEGEGRGTVGERSFGYRERARFWHAGKPFLGYEQRTWAQDDGRPLHSESGYWRAVGGAVELVLAHATGHAEIETGAWEGDRLRLASTRVDRSVSARPVSRLERDLEVSADVLTYELRMATAAGETPWVHLRAELRRLPPR
jgi:hypothetical protein